MSNSTVLAPRIQKSWKASGPLWAPYFNRWNQAVSWRSEPFKDYPWKLLATSTSGSPFIWTGDLLVGMLGEDVESYYKWDGEQLVVDVAEGLLFTIESEDFESALKAYNDALNLTAPSFTFGNIPEYCTWVEQFWLQRSNGAKTPAMALEPDLIFRFLELIAEKEWPRGRVTLDDGWCPSQGPGGYGDWRPRPGFDMAKIASEIRAAGHVPGLWMAPALISPGSERAKACPSLLGPKVGMDGECAWNLNHYLQPGDESQKLINELFQQAYDWGFRKYKLDIFYGDKPLMNKLLEQCRRAAGALPGAVELEGHVPDAFSARYCNVIRTNDVLIGEKFPQWRKVAREHVEVCRQSAPGHLLNLDHIGGNAIDLTPDEFLEHIAMMREWLPYGYPALSVLPARYGQEVEAACTALLRDTGNI